MMMSHILWVLAFFLFSKTSFGMQSDGRDDIERTHARMKEILTFFKELEEQKRNIETEFTGIQKLDPQSPNTIELVTELREKTLKVKEKAELLPELQRELLSLAGKGGAIPSN